MGSLGLLLDGGFLVDVDSIKELSFIFTVDSAGLVDVGAGKGDLVNVISVEVQFFEVLFVLAASDAIKELDNLDDSLTEETADFDAFFVDFNFNREMLFDNVHLISESLGDTLKHILDVGDDGVEDGRLLVGGHVSADIEELDVLLLGVKTLSFDDFDSKVLEGLGQGSSNSLHDNDSGFNLGSD